MANPPTIDYGRAEPGKRTRPAVIAAMLLVVAALLLAAILTWPPDPSRIKFANEIHCGSNLRQISQAIMLYAQDNAGAFPPDLQTVLATQPISADVFTCPSTSDTGAKAPSGLGQPGHCSYIYVGAGLNSKSDPNCIVALEDPVNHEGSMALFADGHVDRLDLPTVMQALNDLAIGRNPPAGSTTFTATSAKKDYEKNWKSRMPRLKSGVWMIPTTQSASPATRSARNPPRE